MERKYLGVVVTKDNYKDIINKDGRDGINFHNNHLKAYLKGKETFTHGYMIDEDGYKRPLVHIVKQTLVN